ncbi:MAG: MFS transporter [bacterium]|nr:MFS transporter [bacterium]
MPNHTIRLYLALTLIRGLGVSFVSATYVTFLLSKHLNLFEINLVNFVYFTTLFLFEIPTGVIADTFGRKISFVLSCLVISLGMFMYGASDSFLGFVMAEATIAIGATFASGAFQAWLVDRLKSQGYADSLGPVFAKEQFVVQGSAVFGAIAGAFLADQNATLPWIAGGIIVLLSGVLAIFFMEEDRKILQGPSLKNRVFAMRSTLTTSFHYVRKDEALRFIMLMGIVQYFAVQAPNMQWQPFFIQFLGNKTSLGLLFGGIAVSIMLGSLLSTSFLRRIQDERKALGITQLVIALGIMGSIVMNVFPIALGIFLFHEIARGMFRPLKDMYLNEAIPSNERATILSVESTFQYVGAMAGLLVSGFLAERFSMQTAWIFSGAVLAVVTLWLLRSKKNESQAD